MGVPDDSPLRKPVQIPYPEPPPPPARSPTETEEERDTPSMRELVNAIDSHMELVDLEITSNLGALSGSTPSSHPDPTALPTGDVPTKPTVDTASCQLVDPAA